MQVTSLTVVRGVARISLDGRFAFALANATLQKFPLRVGDDLDEADYLARVCAEQFGPAYEKALGLLACSARSEAQLRTALLDRGYVEPVVDAACERLRAARLLDDDAFAERFVECTKARGLGRRAVREKLRQRGIDGETANVALAEIDGADQVEAALRIAQSLLGRYAGEPILAQKRKLGAALARRGFVWDDISAALGRLFESGDA